ncbi:MAG TPA: AzlC family ABC transporter permease [Baekduia sp.]|uniref:AzlC family ABC transporter permease n=1 Tax=Baekduia sp. TaxID=2600305 RepID=UPI002B61D428|nr:AzlC family ABC transporter permease [Baekduia sp.]HMJ33868.1 AzlC family ABC transporter permease [Baekduia sp.]
MERTTYVDGARRAWPLAIAVGGFGLTYGVLARQAGFDPLQTIIFSLTTFAGSAQFAAVSIIGDGGTAVAAITAALLLNARYLPIGLSVAPWLRGRPLARAAQGQVVIDESWAVSHLGGGRYDPRLLVGAGLTIYAAWVLASVVGVLAGEVLGDPETLGLDAAFPALFLALLAGQVRERGLLLAALAGGVVALAMVPVVPPGVPIVAASVVCLAGLRRPRVRDAVPA